MPYNIENLMKQEKKNNNNNNRRKTRNVKNESKYKRENV